MRVRKISCFEICCKIYCFWTGNQVCRSKCPPWVHRVRYNPHLWISTWLGWKTYIGQVLKFSQNITFYSTVKKITCKSVRDEMKRLKFGKQDWKDFQFLKPLSDSHKTINQMLRFMSDLYYVTWKCISFWGKLMKWISNYLH